MGAGECAGMPCDTTRGTVLGSWGVGGALPACGCAWVRRYCTICSAEMCGVSGVGGMVLGCLGVGVLGAHCLPRRYCTICSAEMSIKKHINAVVGGA